MTLLTDMHQTRILSHQISLTKTNSSETMSLYLLIPQVLQNLNQEMFLTTTTLEVSQNLPYHLKELNSCLILNFSTQHPKLVRINIKMTTRETKAKLVLTTMEICMGLLLTTQRIILMKLKNKISSQDLMMKSCSKLTFIMRILMS